MIKTTMDPTQPPSEEKGTERVKSICGGNGTWSDFRGTMMGAPFEGHALVAYDEAAKQCISYWIDTMMAGLMTSKGAFDPDSKTVTMEGPAPTRAAASR